MSYPSMPEFVEYVKRYDKRVGLRLLYKKFEIPAGQIRLRFKELWAEVELELKVEGTKAVAGEEVQDEEAGDSNERIFTDEEEKSIDPFSPTQEKITDEPVKKKQEERPEGDEDNEDLIE